ncbi:diguanylate cyclase [Kamptonema formosum]|uniref:diguanylate cyclase n=1 Tax=Kamptonema formosum TaxID=331992 RepID=UPI000371A9FA|nr:diguanylate cyclase [Oscillatoria sp. PCC 10802]
MSHILIVDDDSATRLLLKRTLQTEGYQVTVARNGEEGLALARQLHPDLIICDWMMPVMDGLQMCRQLKADEQLTAAFFILLTWRNSVGDRVEGLDSGADEFLWKPIDMNELQARVRAGLRVGRLMQQLSAANRDLLAANQKLSARNELLESLSLTDQLTGLLNRRALEQTLPHLLQQVGSRQAGARYRYLCAFVIDVDHFKLVNDNYGHQAGDWVLRALAGRLQGSTRPSSFLYRYGGEEFVCIAPGISPNSAWAYGESLCAAISSNPIQVSEDLAIPVTISIGGAIASQSNPLSSQDLLHQADRALYQAKRQGRNRLQMAQPPAFAVGETHSLQPRVEKPLGSLNQL